MKTGLFITLEGVEGVGKTTQIDYVGEVLRQQGSTVLITREPGGTSVGEAIRNILLNTEDLDICPETELLLMFAARAQHLLRVVRPALERGEIVLCDRFTDASYAYQGGGRKLEVEKIQQLEQWVQDELRPDLTILLDAPVEVGMARAGKRGKPDRIESEALDFFEAVRQEYLRRAREEPERIAIVDASEDYEAVQESIYRLLQEKQLLC